ncbi:MAG TPA: hypothetical protein PLE92_06360 [Lentisphaeria bacterium]|nr:hypothetical protein [Lentisphaerota bacterium]HPY90780.1 hypothetical protein [Lentisphaeria bacterium]HQC52739.1 hypothetical protein [Lentisphaeria bacterium]HQL86831.1 hypothetical protein [Lentisphaeria bacterium]
MSEVVRLHRQRRFWQGVQRQAHVGRVGGEWLPWEMESRLSFLVGFAEE